MLLCPGANIDFIFEKGSIPIAAMMDVDEFEDYLELQDPA
jgi:hypothetical protein